MITLSHFNLHYQLLYLCLLLANYGCCLPIVPPSNDTSQNIDQLQYDDNWSLVERRPGFFDVVIPSKCPSSCGLLFQAHSVNVSGSDCACRCSSDTPVFVQSFGQCSNRIEECSNSLHFEGNVDSPSVPLLTLPAPQSVIAPTSAIRWRESNVKVVPSSGVRCNITKLFYLKNTKNWENGEPYLFYIDWFLNDAHFFWNGTTSEANFFEGTIVQLKLNCEGSQPHAHCVSFRVAGQAGPVVEQREQAASCHQSRLETVVIIFLSILLFLSVVGSIVLWNVCWGIKKTELISNIQMHILYQMQQDKEREAVNGLQRHPSFDQALPPNQPNNSLQPSKPDEEMSQDSPQSVVVKRKLFFSAEFFDPYFMMNPPPMAEQFITDLRKMIEIAKQRIQLRRHIPQLVSIPEETTEDYEPYMEIDRRKEDSQEALKVMPPSPSHSDGESQDKSPKSVKSCDSGHDSMKNASSSESVDSDTGSSRPVRSPVPLVNGGVKQLITGFEANNVPPLAAKKPSSSRIPIISSVSKSPRLPVKSTKLTKATTPEDSNQAPPLPPRNNRFKPANSPNSENDPKMTPPSVKNTKPLPPTSTGIPVCQNGSRRKTFAVFPTDAMLKKSLPRRTKRKPPSSTVNGLVETNM